MQTRFFPSDYFLIWLALVSMGLLLRPLTPVDETRVVSVAWEMWERSDFLVPHLNGEPYSHKGPMLQWCIHLSWALFGISEWMARLVAPLFALGNLALTAALARRLWSDDGASARLAPLILLATPLWALWTSLTLYDMVVTFFTLLGLHGAVRALSGETLAGWALTSLAIGGGVLVKGPVVLLTILPSVLFAPGWSQSRPACGWARWYLNMLVAIVLGALIALAWAIPAGIAGGEEYRDLIFWGQSAGRIANSFAHRRPFWWYLALLPALWCPWLLWPPLWRASKGFAMDAGMRFCAIHGLFVLAVFSLISGKQIHYLLPAFPSVALFWARTLSRARMEMARTDLVLIGLLVAVVAGAFLMLPLPVPSLSKNEVIGIIEKAPLAAKLILFAVALGLPWWRPRDVHAGVRGIAAAMLVVMFAAHLVYRQAGWRLFDLQPFADRLAEVEQAGHPIAALGRNNGDFSFLGRLPRPIREINDIKGMLAWMREHPDGYVVLVRKPGQPPGEEGAELVRLYRGRGKLMLWRTDQLLPRMDRIIESEP